MRPAACLCGLLLLGLLIPADVSGDDAATDIVLTRGTGTSSSPSPDRDRLHKVIPGETLSEILTSRGMSLADAQKLIPLVLELNPGLSDADSIFPGQELLLPSDLPFSPASAPPSDASSSRPYSVPFLRGQGNLLPLLQRSLTGIGEEISTSGTLSLPYPRGSAVTIDNSTYPLMHTSTGREIILDIEGRMPEEWKKRIEERWPAYRVVPLPREGDYPDLLQAVLNAGGFHSFSRSERLSFGRAQEVSITPDFMVIKTPESLLDGELYVINILASPGQALPREIRRLAEEHNITVVEVLPVPGAPPSTGTASSRVDQRLRKITASDTRTLLAELLPQLGFTTTGKEPYRYASRDDPAILLEILPDFQVRWEGQTLLIFFDLPDPDILAGLEADDARTLVFSEGDSLAAVLGTLLTAAERSYSGPAVEFYRRDGRFSVAVEGFYLLNDGRPTLLTAASAPPRVASLLTGSGITLITCVIR